MAEKKEEIKEELLDVKEEPPEEDSRETNGRAEAERKLGHEEGTIDK